MSGNYQIPFRDNGELMDWAGGLASGVQAKGVNWKDNFEFLGEVELEGIHRGRSAANFRVNVEPESSLLPDFKATMFMTDFLAAVITKGAEPGGRIRGIFTFVKRGQNYGVKLVD